VGTQVTLASDAACAVVVGAPEQAVDLFVGHGMLVLDDVAWDADMAVIRSGLVKQRRDFKAPFIEKEPRKEVRKQVRNMAAHAERLFKQLYPSFVSTKTRTSFRPMITGPEPLHFDTYGGSNPLVTAYINVSSVPRVYQIGANFPTLVAEQPELMRELMRLAAERGDADLSYVIRQRTGEGLPPLGPEAPRHRVELAPGAIWFFNAKTVSHEVVYGEGTLGVSWEVPDCGAAMQADLLKGLQ
jgi:hypothetical protein